MLKHMILFLTINLLKLMHNLEKYMKQLIDKMLQNKELMSKDIIHINELTNRNIKDTIGYRKINTIIRGTDKMLYFIDNYNNYPINDKNDMPLKITKFHIEFEHIHSFEDGYGITGRILIIIMNC